MRAPAIKPERLIGQEPSLHPLRGLIGSLPVSVRQALWRQSRRPIFTSSAEWGLYIEEWEPVGIRRNTEGKILSFGSPRLLMLDWDNVPLELCVRGLEALCKAKPQLRFRLYRTQNGYHAFCVSHCSSPRSISALSWPARLRADCRYAWNSAYRNRFDVRVSRKDPFHRHSAFLINEIGAGAPNPNLKRILGFYEDIALWCDRHLPSDWSPRDEGLIRHLRDLCRSVDRGTHRRQTFDSRLPSAFPELG